jgi:hypothetical protein
VPEEFDAAKAASLLMRLHGKEAGEVARKRADTRMICGDADGMQAWALVIKALDDQVGSAGTKRPYPWCPSLLSEASPSHMRFSWLCGSASRNLLNEFYECLARGGRLVAKRLEPRGDIAPELL